MSSNGASSGVTAVLILPNNDRNFVTIMLTGRDIA